jgi:sortase A
MLAPAEILQMEGEEEFTPRRQAAKKMFFTQRYKDTMRGPSSAPSASATLNIAPAAQGISSFLAAWRRGVNPLSMLAASLIVGGLCFVGSAGYVQAKAVIAQVLLERAWEATLTTGNPTKAWSWADTWPVARISFPSLGERAIVLQEGGGEAMAFGPAHVAASPKPGATGVSVIGGHRDTHFSFIKDLKVGDEIVIETADRATVRYRMTGSAVVHAGASGISTRAKGKRLALVTCYPFDAVERGPLRYVVFAEAK